MFPYYIGDMYIYTFFNIIGTICGVGVYLVSYYRRNHDLRQMGINFLYALVLLLITQPASQALRVVNNGSFSSLQQMVQAVCTSDGGSHFIGRVLATVWLYPFGYVALRWAAKKLFNMDLGLQPGLDSLSLYFVVQQIFNRIACFCGGCCYGNFYTGIGAVQFPGMEYSVFPTQLAECLWMILLLGWLCLQYHAKKVLFGKAILLFGMGIFLSEFFMNRLGITKYFGLTVVQFCALALMGTGLLYCLKLKGNFE